MDVHHIIRIQGIADQLQPILNDYGYGHVLEAIALMLSERADKAVDDGDPKFADWANTACAQVLWVKRNMGL